MKELIRAAFVIARRDFAATVLSRAFLLFLLGPFFPVLMIAVFGAATGPMGNDTPVVAVKSSEADFIALNRARDRLTEAVGGMAIVRIRHEPPGSTAKDAVATLEGGLANPRLVGSLSPDSGAAKQLRLMIASARNEPAAAGPPLPVVRTAPQPGAPGPGQTLTARAGQSLLFLLTLLLAGMLLSQLIEEKSNKVIEVLAAAVPVDSIFLGKLMAMLTASLLGIAVWTSVGVAVIAALAPSGLSALPAPAVGWPAFLALGLVYFAMSYLLLGSIFLGIGAHASSAREVQTLSMPVTMAQVMVFALASIAVGEPESSRAFGAAAFPLSSPYVMLARAAELPGIMPHLLAIAWQALWVAIFLRFASRIFRRNVLKSGPSGSTKKKLART